MTLDNQTHTPPASAEPTLRRALSMPLVVLYGLGVTVGAGIYVLIGATTAQAGPYAPVAFLVAAVVVAFTAMSYAELAARYPVSAGEAAYVEAGFNSARLATVIGLMVAASGVVSAAAVTIGAAAYLRGLVALDMDILVILVVTLMGAIAIWGIVQSVLIAALITVIELGGLLFVIGWSLCVTDHAGLPPEAMLPPVLGPHWLGIGAASLLAFFAFIGFEDMANVAEEVKDPERTMPRAIALTLVIASVLYVGTTVSVLTAVPLETLSGSGAPLSLVFTAAHPGVQQGFAVIAVVATVNGVLIQMIMASRVLYGMAARGQLPGVLAGISPRTRTPVAATGLVMAVVLALALGLPIDALAEHTSQIVLLVFIAVNVALIRLKRRGTGDAGYFRVPLAVPALGALTSVALLLTSFL